MAEEIVIALIRRQDGAYLITRRPESVHMGTLWEFPGGKLQPGESHEEALRREVSEELAIDIEVGEALNPIDYTYPDRTVRIYPYRAKMKPGSKPVPIGCEEFTWVPPEKLREYHFPPANASLIRFLDPTRWYKDEGKLDKNED